ncbi:ribosomal-processing cysteine protease Prp, partial [Enterococcus faecalis]|nr:ribosomal-processing cysteine protease Prp [Enterococcus faecalis]
DNENGGYLLVTLPSRLTREQSNIAQILLENLLIGLQSVQEEYNDYIQIKTTKEN